LAPLVLALVRETGLALGLVQVQEQVLLLGQEQAGQAAYHPPEARTWPQRQFAVHYPGSLANLPRQIQLD
jgi:hypothetical protein